MPPGNCLLTPRAVWELAAVVHHDSGLVSEEDMVNSTLGRPVEGIHPWRWAGALAHGWERWLRLAVPTQHNYYVEQTQLVG